MKILVTKDIFPVLMPLLFGSKAAQQYNLSDYKYKGNTLTIPNADLSIDKISAIAKVGAIINVAPIWFEIPDANIDDDVPEGVSFRDYIDEFEVPQVRTWVDLGINAQGLTNSLRYWQPSNNGVFNVIDVETIQNAGFEVLALPDLQLKKNTSEYTDTGAPEYAAIETIQFIDENWKYSEYFDMIHAYLNMNELYDAKGIDDNARWAASTDVEKEILVRWNIVGLNKAATIAPTGTEIQQLKWVGHKYREFNINLTVALEARFRDWYQYLNMIFTNAGATKFDGDWDWNLGHQYKQRFIRQYELGTTNDLVTFNNVTLGGYLDSDFFGTIPAATIVNNLEKVLNEKKYFI